MRKWPIPPTEAYRLFAEYHDLDAAEVARQQKQGNRGYAHCVKLEDEWQADYGNISWYDAGEFYHWVVLYEYVTKSRNFAIQTFKVMEGKAEPKTIADYGAGIGLTTALLALLWPKAEVTYINISGPQTEAAKWIFSQLGITNINIISDGATSGGYDLVCAWDVLEHIKEPFAALATMTQDAAWFSTTPSSFTHWIYYGHYREFEVDGETVHHKQMNKRLHQRLETLGFNRTYKSRFWNDPSVYERNADG